MTCSRSWAATLFVIILSIAAGSSAVRSLPLPGVPQPNPQDLAIKAAAKQLTPWVDANQPIIRDWKSTYPTVADLPGKPFVPVHDQADLDALRGALVAQLSRSKDGVLRLPPGDCVFPVTVFCTSFYSGNIHRGYAGHRGLWLLAPLREGDA